MGISLALITLAQGLIQKSYLVYAGQGNLNTPFQNTILKNCRCRKKKIFEITASVEKEEVFEPVLNSVDQSQYISSILRLSVQAVARRLFKDCNLFEIAFPESRKNDISVIESLEINQDFALQFARRLANDKSVIKDPSSVWIVFPDRREGFLALKKTNNEPIPFTVTSIDSLTKQMQSNVPAFGSLLASKTLVFVSPGFNVEEWIAIAKIGEQSPLSSVIVINGQLDRLRSGYYPSFFYPALAAATKSFFSRFTSSFVITPVAVNGDRLGAWLCRMDPNPWVLLVRSAARQDQSSKYQQARTFLEQPEAKQTWSLAKELHFAQWGRRF